jgi:acetylornithine deacetylase
MSETKEALKSTLAQLVAIDTTSNRPNQPIIDLIEQRVTGAGFRCERFRYTDDAGVEKINLLARKGSAKGGSEPAELALVGHTDCVPFDRAWTEALQLTEMNGNLYGRGSCDTKAFIACAIVAAERVKLGPDDRSLLLLFTADEEVGCVGAKRLVTAEKGRARYAIVGEPTSLTPVRANKGYCLAEVEVGGREGHSAYPETGASAIFRAGRFLQRLEARAQDELRRDVDPSFEPPFTSVNVGVISGGKAKNVIPGQCKFTFEWRPIPKQPVEVGLKMLETLRDELQAEEPGFEAVIKGLRMDRGVDTSPESEVVRFIVEQSGKAPTTVPFGTEAPQMTALGAEAVVFGPGDIRVAHRTGEFVPVDELVRCEEVLEAAIRRFCQGG